MESPAIPVANAGKGLNATAREPNTGKAFLKGHVSQIEIQGHACKLKQRESRTVFYLPEAGDIARHAMGMFQKRGYHQKKRRKQ